MANEIVKYANELNTVSFRNFNSREFNIFFSIISRMRNRGNESVTFTFDELRSLAGYKQHTGMFVKDLTNTYSKMLELNMWYEDEEVYRAWTLFTGFEIQKKKENVTVKVNPDLSGVLNELVNWTRFSLEQFASLRSTYSKTVFRLLKQYRVTGQRTFSIDEFRTLLDVPKSYDTSNINKRVLKPIKEELPAYFKGLAIGKLRKGRGGKIVGYKFTWKAEPNNADDFVRNPGMHKRQLVDNIKNNGELTEQEKMVGIAKVYNDSLPKFDNDGEIIESDKLSDLQKQRDELDNKIKNAELLKKLGVNKQW